MSVKYQHEMNTAIDAKQLRQALGRFATGVAIVTARGVEQQYVGLTVNSFSSVSLDPPLVLWSLGNKSSSLTHFKSASHFAVHVLSEEQIDLARRFASNVSERFEGVPVVQGVGSTPLLEGCPVRFHCETVS
jgi:3-hydroxy-9,10-secoandrosta-1,3,5(10)-triene-9,17-dione monooxygenase reductase component